MTDVLFTKQAGAVALWLQSTISMLAVFGVTSSWFTAQSVLLLQGAATGVVGFVLWIVDKIEKKAVEQ